LALTVTRLNHPPAIASTVVFFEAEKQGILLFNVMPLNVTLAFAAGLIIVALTARYILKYGDPKRVKEF
jgi:hypothetical protein